MSDEKIKLPIFVDEKGDLDLYDSVSLVEKELELYDVKKNSYRIFDSEGKEYFFKIEGNSFSIDTEVFSTNNIEEFKSHLVGYIIRNSNISRDEIRTESLAALVNLTLKLKRGCGHAKVKRADSYLFIVVALMVCAFIAIWAYWF